MSSILVVDDEKNQRDILTHILGKEGFDVLSAPSAEEAVEMLRKHEVDVVLADLMLPKTDGLGLLKETLELSPDTSVIIITGHGSIDTAVTAIKRGAFDYLTKPLRKEQIVATVRKALERTALVKDRSYYVERLHGHEGLDGIIGEHPAFKNVLKMLFKISPIDATVLLTGESGTGKEVLARAIHNLSPRKDKPFIPVNCAAIPETLIESELFGYTAGAFTGATSKKKGLFEAASGGTIFLDEVSEIPLAMQVKLLRTLQSKEILPIGSTQPVTIDVRIVAATNRPVENEVRDGRFRADLYYRLNIFSILIPPLRDRPSDIPLLVNYFLERYAHLTGGRPRYFNAEALKLFLDAPWYGNVRELEAVVQKAIIYADHDEIGPDVVLPLIGETGRVHLASPRETPAPLPAPQTPASGQPQHLEEVEKAMIVEALDKCAGNITKASKLLGITFRTLQYRMGKYGIRTKY